MKRQISTDISQSRRLLSCGVDPKTADMWITEDMTGFRLSVGEWHPGYANLNMTPAWSLSALISLLPKLIRNEDMDKCRLSIDSIYDEYCTDNIQDGWEVAWFSYGEINTFSRPDNNGDCVRFRSESSIKACVKAIEWIVNNGYSLNKIEE